MIQKYITEKNKQIQGLQYNTKLLRFKAELLKFIHFFKEVTLIIVQLCIHLVKKSTSIIGVVKHVLRYNVHVL